jgi:ATP-dependent DNA helicase RecG
MTDSQLSALLEDLLRLPNETDWVEFKENVTEPDMIGKRLSGLSNAAALAGRSTGYMVWGVEDGTHAVTGTTFKPLKAKKGGEALINWLLRMVTPNIDFHFREWLHQGKAMVFLEIPAASHQPISFSGTEYIRIDSHTKALKEFPERERALWAMFSKRPFEQGIAKTDLAAEEVVVSTCSKLHCPRTRREFCHGLPTRS